MTAPSVEIFGAAQDAIGWAKDAINELHTEMRQFFADPNTKETVEHIDLDTGDHVIKVRLVANLPKRWRRLATEALNNTKHSFDQIVCAADRHVTRRARSKINFPWASTPTDLKRLLESRSVPEKLWPAIESQEPYYRSDTHPGGNDLIRRLATLANQKHTVGLSLEMRAGNIQYRDVVVSGGAMLGNPTWDPINKEMEIVRLTPPAKFDGNYSVRFYVLFKESVLVEPVDAVFALQEFAGRAEMFLHDMKALCSQ